MTFESSLARLEAIVNELNRDDVPLDRALSLFEEGIGHLKTASAELQRAEGVLKTLVKKADGTFETVDKRDG
ncbi:MAG TPA: exodeoxyribonuclease VII small subunit [Gemmatimonadaceae bacterium]|nr:exodeoxyribonuclease VII small subunit [Gemmatimonadaceae bacterium]